MNIAEFMQVMEGIAPQETAEPWDNPGLLAGDPETELNGVLVCVDATHAALDAAEQCGANLILSHHPLMFHGVKSLRQDGYEGAVLSRLLRENRALFAAHTNLDKAEGGVNDCLVRALGFYGSERPEDYLRLCDLSPRKAGEMLERVRKTISPQAVFYGKTDRWISRAAVSCGAGGEFAAQAAALGADLFITGEMKHNERIEAQGLGMSVLLLGHGESESPVLEPLAQRLREKLSVPVRIYDERNL